jgi:transposase
MTLQWYNAGMKPTYVPPLTEQQLAELDELYRTTKVPRVRTRAQMILLSAEKRLKVGEIAEIVRESETTVLRWLKRYIAESVEGLQDAPRSGRERAVTAEYRETLIGAVRRRPRSLALDFSIWTLQRLVDYMAEETGIRVSTETVRRTLKDADIVLSRPQHTISSPDPEYQVKKRRSKTHETV